MRRIKLISASIVLLVGWFASVEHTQADPPDVLTSYQFVQRLSTLRQTGGIAGIDEQYPVFGTYDFVTGFQYESGTETDAIFIRPYAQFTHVEAYGAHPTMDPGLSLDVVLNLSVLDGEPIYKGPSGLELFRFEGATVFGEPSRVELLAARLGRWMYLRGQTEAPCCDFFEYELRGLARQLPSSDWDDDGVVDNVDLAQWIGSYGAGMTGHDFLEWQRQFGDQAPSLALFDTLMNDALAAISAGSVVVVPEPSAFVFTVATAAILCGYRRIH